MPKVGGREAFPDSPGSLAHEDRNGREDTKDLRALIEALAEIPLEFSPGTHWNYSVSTDGLGCAKSQLVGSPDVYAWGGAASTVFWIDLSEELITIFMTQLMPSRSFNFRGQLKSIIYSSLVD